MANIETFDDFESSEKMNGYSDIPPFQFREDTSKEATLEWLNENFDRKVQSAQSRVETYRRYQSYYKGIFWRDFNTNRRYGDGFAGDERRKPKMSVNFIYDKTEDRVAQMDRISTAITLIPSHNEQSDINNARACSLLLKARGEELDLHKIMNDADKTKFLFGSVFTYVGWDKSIGPDVEVPDKYADGIPIVKDGKKTKKKYKGELKMGDVKVCVYGPDRVFPQLGKKRWEDVDELDQIDFINKWELKKEYPKEADNIECDDTEYRGIDNDTLGSSDDNVTVRTFYHRKTKWLPNGAKIVWVRDAILSWEDLPYENGELPFDHDRDIEVYGELFGRSFISNIERLQLMYNNTQSSQARDYGIGSAPKWLMPKGSAKASALNNEFTIIEFTGPIAPRLETPRPTNPQSFDFQDRTENKITRLSRTSDISRGEPPKGVTANSALRFLDEQESRMIAPMEKKRKSRVRRVNKMMINVMQQYYKPNDGRMVRILGEDNSYMIKSFEKADFTRVYDVKIQNSSALPDTKTGKISTIVDLNIATQTDPVFKKEEIIEMLDLGIDNAFVDGATVAVTSAKTIVEAMLNGEPVPEPQEFDNFMVYYRIFDRTMQSFSFRTNVDPVVQETFKQYLKVLEGLMWARAKKNAKFAMELSNLDNYPMFFTTDIPLSQLMMMHQGAAMQPQAPQTGQGINTEPLKKEGNNQGEDQ